MNENNPRKNNNNWRVAAMLLSYDIKRYGFRDDLHSKEVSEWDEERLVELIDSEPFVTGYDIADNIIHDCIVTKERNRNSNKIWRGDIEACYARMLKNISCCRYMITVKDPTLFGWDEEEWNEVASGRSPMYMSVDANILLECSKARTERDQAYLYNRIKYLIDPKPVMGINSVPIPDFNFRR